MIAIDLYIQCFLAYPVTKTFGTGCSSAVPAEYYPVLDLVQILLYFPEKVIDAFHMDIAFPQNSFLFRCKVCNGFVNREIETPGTFDKVLPPLSQFFTFPRSHGTFINAE